MFLLEQQRHDEHKVLNGQWKNATLLKVLLKYARHVFGNHLLDASPLYCWRNWWNHVKMLSLLLYNVPILQLMTNASKKIAKFVFFQFGLYSNVSDWGLFRNKMKYCIKYVMRMLYTKNVRVCIIYLAITVTVTSIQV